MALHLQIISEQNQKREVGIKGLPMVLNYICYSIDWKYHFDILCLLVYKIPLHPFPAKSHVLCCGYFEAGDTGISHMGQASLVITVTFSNLLTKDTPMAHLKCKPCSTLCLLCSTHNPSDKYPTMHHFVTEMCKHVHISVTTCCIVGYGAGALWDLCNRLISCFFFFFIGPFTTRLSCTGIDQLEILHAFWAHSLEVYVLAQISISQ